ncbi:hypothetical protein KSP40_PGU004582 [Platanthera guangdongensis]|uniref:Uncharacterized protein n=1 Tax=Platanthera guangdongensis TaxID=2320717 RepID=A0ABR2MZQ1_9ASPA
MGSQSRFLSSFTIVRHLPRRFSSSPFSSSFVSFTNWGIPESVAYLRSMRRPPSKVLSRMQRLTSCSFIGTLYNHVQCSRHCSDILRAFVSLEVKSDHRLPNSSCFTSFPFTVLAAYLVPSVARRSNESHLQFRQRIGVPAARQRSYSPADIRISSSPSEYFTIQHLLPCAHNIHLSRD